MYSQLLLTPTGWFAAYFVDEMETQLFKLYIDKPNNAKGTFSFNNSLIEYNKPKPEL